MEYFYTPYIAKAQKEPKNYKCKFMLSGFRNQPLKHIDIKVYSKNAQAQKNILSKMCQVTLSCNGHIIINKMIDHQTMASLQLPEDCRKFSNMCLFLKVRFFETPISDYEHTVYCEAIYFYDNEQTSDDFDFTEKYKLFNKESRDYINTFKKVSLLFPPTL